MGVTFDVIVVGVGAMGAATCWSAARGGASVLGLEQFDIPHTRGSSHGYSRMTRMAYYERPEYVPLLRRANLLWRKLERESNQQLLHQIGGVFIGPPDGMLIRQSVLAARFHRLPHEQLDVTELRKRFPQFRVPPDWQAVYDPNAGLLLPELAISTLAAQAMCRGAVIRAHETLHHWRASRKHVEVATNAGKYRAQHLVITAGPWASRIVGRLGIRLRVSRQVLGWVWPRKPRLFERDRFPVWGIDSGDGGIYYGFPMLPAAPGLKLAHHLPGPTFDPVAGSRDVSMDEEADFRPALRYIPMGNGPLCGLRMCLYTNSPDGDFIIDTHPQHENVHIACGFSGHGFKFATVVGEVLARRVTGTRWDARTAFLRLARFA